ncbi:GNAT family N-acetyltransferase [Loigolactobacillus binensis]|uniref:GNAT family N-acetyltransferase n=1 Tax=Loigolactobacillus binensis TaxID=2559922 RepID=A0ABW3EBF5_9LACO|nr:GNAT family N-acetyltransferase [Loigolactobacillus binensis]
MGILVRELLEHAVITARRVKLRPVTLADNAAMFTYASDPATAHYIFPVNYSLEDSKTALLDFFMTRPAGQYGIASRANDQLIGAVQLLNLDENNRKAGLTYVLNPAYQHQGYMQESLSALLATLFHQTSLQRLYALHEPENQASAKVMLAVGLQQEGLLHQTLLLRHQFVDGCLHALTRDQYLKEHEQE